MPSAVSTPVSNTCIYLGVSDEVHHLRLRTCDDNDDDDDDGWTVEVGSRSLRRTLRWSFWESKQKRKRPEIKPTKR